MMRILSWTLSFLLHACIALAGMFLATPNSMLVDLSVPVYQVELVNLTPRKGRPAKPAPAKPEAKPEPRPEARPVAAKPEPAPKPEAKEIAAKAEKPKQPEAKDIAKKEPPKPEKPKKPEKTKKQLLAEALARAQQDVKWLERKEAKERKKALSEALAQAEADAALAEAAEAVEDAEIGAGGEDEDGAMLGLREIYALQVKEIVKANWRYPSIPVDGALVAGVSIRVGPAGHITEYALIARSGRPDFDESVLKAVEETAELPPPPGDIEEIRINFNLQELR